MQGATEADELVEEQECEVCGELMDYYNQSATENQIDTALDEDADMWLAWKPADCAKVTFHACGTCKILAVSHNACGHAMLFVGHMGFSTDGDSHMRNAKTRTKANLGFGVLPKDRNTPRFDVGDCGKYKFRVDEWKPCGPDGTYKHFWSCEECKVELSFSEK